MSSVVDALKNGQAALIATDTVYGLAALPGGKGYDDIFRLKQRDADQVLPWLVSGIEDLSRFGKDVPDYALRLAAMFWPGALTLVVSASDSAAEYGCIAKDGTVALRCPDDEVCLSLLSELAAPLACTSANLHGEDAPSRLGQVDPEFTRLPHADDLPEACKGGLSSTIVDCTGLLPRVIRQGSISEHVLHVVSNLDATLF